MKKKVSLEAELVKAEMLYNRIFEVYKDIYDDEIKRIDTKKDRVISVVTFVIGEKGYSRLNNELLPMNSYFNVLLLELKQLEILSGISNITGRRDFRGFSKMFSSEEGDEGK